MLEVHPPHEAVHGWRDFLIHIATITIGLLIALALENLAEWVHHHHQVAETQEALRHELEENHARFAANTGYFRRESAILTNNLLVLTFMQKHPNAPANQWPGILLWQSSHARMEDSAWRTAVQSGIPALMPQSEVMRTSELYAYFERAEKAHEEQADALTEAVGFMALDPDPSHLTPAQLSEELSTTRRVLARHIRFGFLLQNLAEQYPDFRPAPQRQELEQLLHLSDLEHRPDLAAANAETHKRMEAFSAMDSVSATPASR